MTTITPTTKRTAPTKPTMVEKRDLGLVAHVAWIDFQLAKCDIDTINQRLAGYEERLANAKTWFNTHTKDDPDYVDARSLMYDIAHKADDDRAIRQMRTRGALHHLWNCCLACNVIATSNAPELIDSALEDFDAIYRHYDQLGPSDGTTARLRGIVTAVWREQLPTTPLPTYMPDDSRANWIEYRLGAVPVWSLDELQETLDEKRGK